MSGTASPQQKKLLIGLLAVAVLAVGGFAAWRLTSGDSGDDDKVTPETSSVTQLPTEDPSPAPSPTATPRCEGPDTSLQNAPETSLLPDCGEPVVTHDEQKKSGLGLGCGGTYPVILYKTTTSGAKTSICGTDATGEKFRMVTQERGGPVLDMAASYDSQRDAFVARKDGTSYSVLAYNGSLVVTKNGQSTTQTSDNDWISLDNESDDL
ncbi:hypothetical protein GCM10022234_24750 [Aeromicrobium panaciterrae]|uniref:hypothetical protein n=1 Tax=Aeromicrobium panaciterrae TaxID=363861 RepID=UPI0031DAC01E